MSIFHPVRPLPVRAAVFTAIVSAAAMATGTASAVAVSPAAAFAVPAGFHATVFAAGSGQTLYGPDDITELDGHVFVAFQNGVGTMGEPSSAGNIKSTVVEYTRQGHEVARWNVVGKVDGLGADPSRDRVIATVNEDGNSSLYTITPELFGPGSVKHYTYSQNPLPHGGGTDSVVVRDGVIFISASNPSPDSDGTTFSAPALYVADLHGTTAALTPALMDDSSARDAVTGARTTLNLSDPDSNETVPADDTRFGGDVLLTSQGDGEMIFLRHPGTSSQRATVLNLSTQIDDTAFPTGCGTLYVVDGALNEVVAITGDFHHGQVFSAVPNDSTVIPGNLATVNLGTGTVTAFGSGFSNPKGLLFVAGGGN